MPSSPLSTSSERALSLLYVVAGSVVLSEVVAKLAMCEHDVDHVDFIPLRAASPIGEASRLKFDDESPRRG